jgi:predicted aspartyl protease
MKIILSKHAQFKFRERKIEIKMIEKVLESYEYLFYDLIAKTMVAAGKIKIDDTETNLVVIFTKRKDEIYIVTAYPVKNIDKEIKNKEGKRWIRI